MKKRKKSTALPAAVPNNPVAKFARQFNKAAIFKDKSKYNRKAKHKGQEPFPMKSREFTGKGFGRTAQSSLFLAQ
ncbi:DUF7230 family protein [Methylomarinum vadi]|uniref:DUF7230 family protein n=1 Tax=Methylomarinum vadi TaxID=438855 RepID=UPI00055B178A|nr:hypothetical protein [Methylomarinum vadi]